MSANDLPSDTGKQGMHPLLRAFLGLLLLLPACGLCSSNLFLLSLNTFMGGLRSSSLAGPGKFVGMENFERLFSRPGFSSSFGSTALLILVQVLAWTVLPILLAFAVNALGRKARRGTRFWFTLPLAFFGPALVMFGPSFARGLWNMESPGQTYLLLEGLAGLAAACGIGLVIYSAILRGRDEVQQGWRPILLPLFITWLVLQLAVAAYVMQTFDSLSGLLPNWSDVPLGYFLFQTLRQAQGGLTFAVSAIIFLVVALLGILATVLLILGRLRLKYEPRDETAASSARGSALGWIVIVVAGFVVFAVTVLPVLIGLFRTLASLGDGLDLFGVSIPRVWLNSLLPPALVIFLIQLPVAYLGALGIGAVRPFGRWSEWLLLLFSPWLFVTSLPFAFASFQYLREAELTESLFGLTPPILLSVPMLFVFTLFFMGQAPKWQAARAEGMSAARAFFKHLIVPSLPLAAFLAAFSLLAATQDLIVPLLAGLDPDLLTATTAILKLSAGFDPDLSSSIITLFGLPLSLIFFIVFAVLQISYLDRLTLTREPIVKEPEKAETTPADL
ncbi:MAG: hypothetical protein AB1554_00920 [Chloroflexota bacterium]